MAPSSPLPKLSLHSILQLQPWLAPFSILVALALFFALYFSPFRPKLPPGPPRWPIVGHLLMVRSRFLKGHVGDLAMDLQSKYGPIFTLWFGPVPIIVISGASLAHETMVRRGALFGSRPAIHSEPIFTDDKHYISSAPYGPFWRSVRRSLTSVMLQPARVKTFKPVRDMAIGSMIESLMGEAASNNGVVPELFSNCTWAISKILFFMCFGWHLEDSVVSSLAEVQHRVFESHADMIQGDNLFDRRRYMKERRMLHEKLMELSALVVEEFRARRKEGQIFPGSYMETLYALEPNEGVEKLTDIQIITLCAEFLHAGNGPTAICLEWAMANLVLHQDIQALCYSEIEDAVKNRPVEEQDLEKLPYLQAVLAEALRLHPPVHFTLPHAVTEPCKLAGYDIPTKAIILVHLAAISRDPSIWVDPMRFKPERFLRRERVDMTGSKLVELIPFGAGRRGCPGLGLAMMHAGVLLARMIQAFEWSSALEDGEVMDMADKKAAAVAMRMRTPLRARIRQRSPSSSASPSSSC